MINKSWMAAGLLLTAMSGVHAAEKCAQTTAGNVVMSKVSMECMHVMGNARITQTSIHHGLNVVGALNVIESNLNDVAVVGHASFVKSTVTGPVNIVGGLIASKSTFEDNIKVSANTVKFDAVTLQGIEIKASQKDKTPYLYLSDNTVVKGDVVFVNSPGVVVSHQSKILGKIVNGKQMSDS